jgi:carotenoid cleavage dioxygenase
MDADDEILTQPGTELFKYDTEDRSVQVRDFGKNCHPGEFVFVRSGDGDNEDDGWLMGFVVDAENRTTELMILSAGDITGPAQARIHIPHAVPSGFHGNWV